MSRDTSKDDIKHVEDPEKLKAVRAEQEANKKILKADQERNAVAFDLHFASLWNPYKRANKGYSAKSASKTFYHRGLVTGYNQAKDELKVCMKAEKVKK